MKLQASLANNARAQTALGTIVAYDENNYYVNCELYPADPNNPASQPTFTGWIPLGSPWVGNGWGFFAPPNIGDTVAIEYQEGSFQNAVATMRFFQLDNNLAVPSGEMWLVHETGSYIKMTNNGKVSINSTNEIDITAPAVNIGGTISLGDLGSALSGFLNGAAMSVYNSHTHTAPSGGGITSAPIEQMSGSDLSTNVLGN